MREQNKRRKMLRKTCLKKASRQREANADSGTIERKKDREESEIRNEETRLTMIRHQMRSGDVPTN